MINQISFSIVTVTLNARKELIKTINSIQEQSYPYYSHIIKDGNSKDKTNKLNFSKYKKIKFFESKDKGVYDAMNQAFKFAENEFIIFLNAGDVFLSKISLEELALSIRKYPNYNSYSGGTLQINPKDQIIKRKIGVGNLYKLLPLSQLPHPSFIMRKSILSMLNNPFDADLEIAADYKQQLTLRKKKLWKNFYLDQVITIMPIGGISTFDKKSIFKGYKETFIFSYKKYKILALYIIFIKIILNFYSRLKN